MIYLTFPSHRTPIQSQPQKNKTINHSQYHFEFIFSKDTTINSCTAPKSHVKLITYMNTDNIFYLLVAVEFAMIPQVGVLGPKAQHLVIYFCLL